MAKQKRMYEVKLRQQGGGFSTAVYECDNAYVNHRGDLQLHNGNSAIPYGACVVVAVFASGSWISVIEKKG